MVISPAGRRDYGSKWMAIHPLALLSQFVSVQFSSHYQERGYRLAYKKVINTEEERSRIGIGATSKVEMK